MVTASICDHDEGPVMPMIDDGFRQRALGMQRAVADRELSGQSLLRLLADDRWDLIESLASESNEVHKRVRGRRIAKQPPSAGLEQMHAATA